MIGKTLLHYEVTARIGAGGMGEVYRATDTKLGREVAIKVLPADVAGDADRLARFRREAHLLASLNHPNIAGIYGVEEADGTPFLVLELVEGEDLAERLERGRLPVDETLEIARQIAEGLEEAHEKGIIHRDLKPANVKLTPDSRVKVLDFGLARVLEDEPDSATGASSGLSQSPTLAHCGTQAGAILGTAAYMSPEQARGKAVDKRTDIWAFGVVVFEMLTGQRLFRGEEVSDTLASILKDEPDWTRLPTDTPRRLRDLLHRCLRKQPQNRLRDIGDARIEVAEVVDGVESPAGPPSEPLSRLPRVLPWSIAGVATVALGVALWPSPSTPSARDSMRLEARLGSDLELHSRAINFADLVVLSPDGGQLAFVGGRRSEPRRIYVRPLDQLEARPLPGTEGALSPFFSPDGRSLGFFAGNQLRKIGVAGGASVTLVDAVPNPRGGSWGEDGTLVLAPGHVRAATEPATASRIGLQTVSSAGGEGRTLTTPDPAAGEATHRWPQWLGPGRVLYTAASRFANYEDANLVIEVFPDGPRKIIHRGGYHGRYLPSGHLVFMHEGTLFAAPLDLGRMELSGAPVPVIEGVWANPGFASAQFSVSDTGILVYVNERITDLPVHWMDRGGATTPLRDEPARWVNPRFSPDGSRVALQIDDGRQSDIWIYEWARDTLTRLTSDPAEDQFPVWTPDGRRVVFASRRGEKGVANLYWRRSDGSGEAERLTQSESVQFPSSWHPSGRFLAFYEAGGASVSAGVRILEMESDGAGGWSPGATTAFIDDSFTGVLPAFSPDGRFLAYSSMESGDPQVYVRSFPGAGGKWQVSAAGGLSPTWSMSRPELLYETEGGQIMRALYAVKGDSFRSEQAVPWSDVRLQPGRMFERHFDLHPDGERIAVGLAQDESGAGPDSVVVVTGFFDELRHLTGESGE